MPMPMPMPDPVLVFVEYEVTYRIHYQMEYYGLCMRRLKSGRRSEAKRVSEQSCQANGWTDGTHGTDGRMDGRTDGQTDRAGDYIDCVAG
ncbi:hypothetical protein M0804_001126 [Polistes exclamans]|nr:hypothetical protein M0804_001126 [Polistes exclamans]